MSKIVPLKDFGIPVNSAIPATDHIIAYYGPHPLDLTNEEAIYAQRARIDCGPISGLKVVTDSAGASVWDLSEIASSLPTGLSGSYDFVFTNMDANGNESNFSPILTVEIDTTVPLALGQPVEL
ncbi:MAG: hypothetical protein ACP5P4_15790 [Steroidobacteraceae bacterium]